MVKYEDLLMRREFREISYFMCALNTEVLSADSDKRKDAEIAHDYGVEDRSGPPVLFSQADAFLRIQPWPWWEICTISNRHFSGEYHTRKWFEKMLKIARAAYDDPNAVPTGKAPPKRTFTDEEYALNAELTRATLALGEEPEKREENEEALRKVVYKIYGVKDKDTEA